LVNLRQQAPRACLALRLDVPHEADDSVQEAFIAAFTRLREFGTESPAGTLAAPCPFQPPAKSLNP
jgi:DNA-directed RNA polymerase specialized sigma24 family protein